MRLAVQFNDVLRDIVINLQLLQLLGCGSAQNRSPPAQVRIGHFVTHYVQFPCGVRGSFVGGVQDNNAGITVLAS